MEINKEKSLKMKIYFIVYFILFVANYNVFFYADYMPELLFVSLLYIRFVIYI